MPERHTLIRRRWFFAVVLAAALTLTGAVWFISSSLDAVGDMTNQIYQEVKSPDGRYVATLAYRDGMTFGFGYVCLQPVQSWHPLRPDDPLPNSEVVEVAAEGLGTISWKGNHTLVVTYEESGNEAAQFVSRPKQWHDVKIVYHGTP